MLLSGNRPVNTALNSAFPLFHVTAYDFFYKNSPWPVGLQSTNSTAVKKKIAAVIISEFTGLKSLDNILRTYLKDTTYPNGDKDRLDLRVDAFITKRISNFDTQIFALSFQQFNSSNPVFSLFPFGRAKFTTELLMCCAHKGALFEFVAIARMMLEQIAWAFELSKSLDDDAVRNVSATRSISQLRKIFPYAGKLYGWLSSHVHWDFDGHKKTVISEGGKLGHLFASTYFKAVACAIALIFVVIYFDCVWKMFPDRMLALNSSPNFENTQLNVIKEEARALMDEILMCDPKDLDLLLFATMLSRKEN